MLFQYYNNSRGYWDFADSDKCLIACNTHFIFDNINYRVMIICKIIMYLPKISNIMYLYN